MAATYRGEGLRLLSILKSQMGDVDTQSLRRRIGPGVTITVCSSFGQDSIEINAQAEEAAAEEEKRYNNDVIVFYTDPDGVKRVALTDTRAFSTEESPLVKSWLASEWGMDSFPASNMQIIGMRFPYKGKNVWYYRVPFQIAASASPGDYLFHGFTYGGIVDYMYVEETGKWYQLQTGPRIQDPFAIGGYIYIVKPTTMEAWDFNFDTEALALIDDQYTPDELTHVTPDGVGYYTGIHTVFMATAHPPTSYPAGTGLMAGRGPAWWYFGWTQFGAAFLYEIYPGLDADRKFSAWPGTGFTDPYHTEGANEIINLYAPRSWNFWTGLAAWAETPLWETTTMCPYDTSYFTSWVAPFPNVQAYTDLGRKYQKYMHYPAFGRVLGNPLNYTVISHTKEIFNDPNLFARTFYYTNDGTVVTQNQTFNFTYSESQRLNLRAWTLSSSALLTYAHTIGFIGTYMGPFFPPVATSRSATVNVSFVGTRVVATPEVLPWPIGEKPFVIMARRTYSRILSATGNLTGATIIDSNPSAGPAFLYPTTWHDVRTLYTPYGNFPLTETETITAWEFIYGKEVLIQALKAQTSFGNKSWANGNPNGFANVARYLDTTEDRIHGVMYCPKISQKDVYYLSH